MPVEKFLERTSPELKLSHGELECSWMGLSLSLCPSNSNTENCLIHSAMHTLQKMNLASPSLMSRVESLGPTWVEGKH